MPTLITRVSGSRVTIAEKVWMLSPAFQVLPLEDGKLRLITASPRTITSFTGPRLDQDGREGFSVFLHHVQNQLSIGDIGGKTEGEGKTRASGEASREELCAATTLIALDVFEEQGRPLPLQDAPSDCTDLTNPVHLGNYPPQLTFLLKKIYPLPQIHEVHRSPAFGRK